MESSSGLIYPTHSRCNVDVVTNYFVSGCRDAWKRTSLRSASRPWELVSLNWVVDKRARFWLLDDCGILLTSFAKASMPLLVCTHCCWLTDCSAQAL